MKTAHQQFNNNQTAGFPRTSPAHQRAKGQAKPKKITLATIKAFVRNNDNLFIKVKSRFDGMTDGVEGVNMEFLKVVVDPRDYCLKHTLGIQGAWLVGDSRDYFTVFKNDKYEGYEVYNCCGAFFIATEIKG